MKDRINVFTSDDDHLKTLGELLANETSRKIILCLIEKQMYTNEIATKLDIPISLVIHHLKKLDDLRLLETEEKKISRKTKEHKFFRMRDRIFVLPGESREEIAESGLLSRIFQDKVRYIITGVAAAAAFMISGTKDSQYAFISADQIPQDATLIPFIIIAAAFTLEVILHKKRKGVSR